MCGIAAWIGFGPIDPQIQRLQRAQDAMLHRGPDSAGNLVWSEGGGVLLTHRRLAIQDLSAKGQQPLASADGRMWMIFNGEIYNHLELRAELEQAGHRFGSRCDSEVLLAAYVEWGEAMLGRLVGMFALVILDTRREEVFLARDPLGIKPLYYRHQGTGLELASEIGALLAMDPDEPVAIHRPALWDYLTEGDTDHREATLVDGVNAFPAGCSARIALAGEERAIELSPTRYWPGPRALAAGPPLDIDYAEAVREVRERFMRNVELHMRADVPVGTLLSGGVDSSAIVMAMRELAGPTAKLRTFSYVGDHEALDESPWIDEVVRAAGSEHHRLELSAQDYDDSILEVARAQGEPVASLAVFAQAMLFRLAAQHGVRVVLDGQGADEILAGYRWAWAYRIAEDVRSGHWVRAFRFAQRLARLHQRPDPKLSSVLRAALRQLVPRRSAAPPPAWIQRAWFAKDAANGAPARASVARSFAERTREVVTRRGLPALLRFEDRNSMAASVEARLPFLTADFVEFVSALPEAYRLADDGTGKRVFRDAMRGIVPDAILDRREKVGFSVPLASFPKRSPRFRELLASSAQREAVDGAEVRAMLAALEEPRPDAEVIWTAWRLVGFEAWMQAARAVNG